MIFDISTIKAILFDSGKVLNGSLTGHWFMPPNFFLVVDKNKFKFIHKSKIVKAFNTSNLYISNQMLITDEKEEFLHFIEYYRIFSKTLPKLKLNDAEIRFLAKDLVYNCSKYSFYKDVVEVIPKLSRNYKLAVVSDAWPSLENVFRASGLRDYFYSFIIYCKKGVTKPHELMYTAALEELGVSPEEVIFIDDNIKNCDGAKSLGIRSFVMSRDLRSYWHNKLIC